MEAGAYNESALLKEIPRRTRMLAHKKTRKEYEQILTRLNQMGKVMDLSSIDRELEAVKIQAEKRFAE